MLNKLLSWLASPFESIIHGIKSLIEYINPFSDKFFLKIAFVPETNNLIFDEVKETLYNKFGFISSFEKIHNSFENLFNKNEGMPSFTITLPDFLGGATVTPINFSFFDNYRGFIHGFIIAVSYFLFIEKIYKTIPKILKGG